MQPDRTALPLDCNDRRFGLVNEAVKKQKRNLQFIRNISRLATMEGAIRKEGRRVQAEDLSWIDNAAMLIEDGRVLQVGPERTLAPKARRIKASIEEVDVHGRIVTPAFTECHTHLIYGGNRAAEFERRNQGESYQSIAKSGGGILATVIPTREASEKELIRIGQERADRFVRQGVTTIEAKTGYGLELDTEFRMLQAAGKVKRARIIRTFLGAHAIPKEFASAEAFIDHLIENGLSQLKEEGAACRVDIFVEDGYFSRDVAHRYLKAAKGLGFDLVVHADQLTLSGGADLAVEFAARSADHLIQIGEREIAKLAASEVTCVLLPSADLYMKCAYPPARALIEKGARVALATDLNPGTAPSQDLALVGVLARLQMGMTLAEVFAAYTVGSAYALGLGGELGGLLPGRLADFNVLSGEFEDVFLSVGQMPIESVYREGRQLV